MPPIQPSTAAHSRRRFLQIGSALAVKPASIAQAAAKLEPATPSGLGAGVRNCITLLLVGSPGHLDTWDMKPQHAERNTGAVSADRDQRARH